MLLTRKEFRKAVFKRDKGCCIVCGKLAIDAHHIMERRLFPDGGYYLDNGASLCERCHIDAESTRISPEELRSLAKISRIVLPPHLYQNEVYDKWGNIVLPNGNRIKGELFYDDSAQRIYDQSLKSLFVDYVKYPRTYHLPWSSGGTKDDRFHQDTSIFEGREVVVTIKMDGENTSIYKNYLHARSIDYHSHPSRDYVKNLQASIGHEIPEGWRICGENLYAKHSIHYKNLSSYFQVFSVWNDKNICLSWDDTVEWSDLLGLELVPILYRGYYSKENIEDAYNKITLKDGCEGYVLRVVDEINYRDFKNLVGKYVRANHVTSSTHWIHRSVTKNELAE